MPMCFIPGTVLSGNKLAVQAYIASNNRERSQSSNRSTLDYTLHCSEQRIVHFGDASWKRLCSSSVPPDDGINKCGDACIHASVVLFSGGPVVSVNVPPELPEILKRYTKAAIKTQPADVLAWSAAWVFSYLHVYTRLHEQWLKAVACCVYNY